MAADTPILASEELLTADPSQLYDRGYSRAREDLLAELVFHAEQYLRDHGGESAWTRKFLYRFIDRLERQWIAAEQRNQMEGGLGI